MQHDHHENMQEKCVAHQVATRSMSTGECPLQDIQINSLVFWQCCVVAQTKIYEDLHCQNTCIIL